MVVVGGLGSVPGAILGAVFIKSTEWFQGVVPQSYQFLFRFAGSGIGLIVVLWLLPGGLGSLLYKLRDTWLRRVAARRHIVVPSLIADTGADPELLTGRKAKPAVAIGVTDGGAPRSWPEVDAQPAPSPGARRRLLHATPTSR